MKDRIEPTWVVKIYETATIGSVLPHLLLKLRKSFLASEVI